MQEDRKMRMKKALSVNNVMSQRVDRLKLSEPFYQAFGKPQDFGVWFVWGSSGSGKSTFVMQLAKELAQNYKLAHNTLEEDTDDAEFIDRMKLVGMQDVESNHHSLQYYYDDLNDYLTKRNSPKVVIIDSAHYFFRSFSQYLEFKARWVREHKKILILTGSAKGEYPASELLLQIMQDAKMKINVSAYAAICKGRTIGPNGGRFIVWKEGYERLHGVENLN